VEICCLIRFRVYCGEGEFWSIVKAMGGLEVSDHLTFSFHDYYEESLVG
jgi:hypothetical protein